MNNKDIIASARKGLASLLKFMTKPIRFETIDDSGNVEQVESYKFKSVIDGRKQLFEDARICITHIRQMEEKEGVDDSEVDKNYRKNLQDLVDSTEVALEQVKMVLEKEIDVDDEDDEKVKMISQSKVLSLELMMHVTAVSGEIRDRLSSNKNLIKNEKRSFVEQRVKGRIKTR